jgi:hypothetical protein
LDHCEMVIGSKTFGSQRRTPLRILGSQLYVMFTQLFFGLAITDFSMGAKAFRRSAIRPALQFTDRWTGYVLELALFLNHRGRRIIQLGVDCNDTRKSRFSLLHEGLYRYSHLWRCFKKMKDPASWYNQVKTD